MIRKFVSAKTKTITGAALVLSAASIVSRLIGVLRDRIFADQFGAGRELDIYYAAFRVPDLLYTMLIVGALSAGFIPVFMRVFVKSKKQAWLLTSRIISIVSIALVFFVVLLFITMPYLVQILTPGFSLAAKQQTVLLSRIMLLSPLFLGLSGVVSGVLQSLKHFLIYSATPIVYNIGIIIGAIFFVPVWGLEGLAYGVVLGALLHLSIQLPSLFHQGFHFTPSLGLSNGDVREIGRLMIPRTLTLATSQLNLIIVTVIASTLATGSITVYTFANNLQFFPVGIIGISFALAAFPTLTEFVANQQRREFVTHIAQTIRQILFFIIPLTVIFLILRAQIVRVVLGSGKFDWDATIATADTLALFSLSLFAQALIPLLIRAFYALHNTFTPLVISFIAFLINIVAALALKDVLGVRGLGLAFSIAAMVQLTMLWFSLRHHVKDLNESTLIRPIYKFMVAGLAMGVVMQLGKEPLAAIVDMTRFWGIFVQGATLGILGLTVYGLVLLLLRSDDCNAFLAAMQRRWLRVSAGQAHVNEPDAM